MKEKQITPEMAPEQDRSLLCEQQRIISEARWFAVAFLVSVVLCVLIYVVL